MADEATISWLSRLFSSKLVISPHANGLSLYYPASGDDQEDLGTKVYQDESCGICHLSGSCLSLSIFPCPWIRELQVLRSTLAIFYFLALRGCGSKTFRHVLRSIRVLNSSPFKSSLTTLSLPSQLTSSQNAFLPPSPRPRGTSRLCATQCFSQESRTQVFRDSK